MILPRYLLVLLPNVPALRILLIWTLRHRAYISPVPYGKPPPLHFLRIHNAAETTPFAYLFWDSRRYNRLGDYSPDLEDVCAALDFPISRYARGELGKIPVQPCLYRGITVNLPLRKETNGTESDPNRSSTTNAYMLEAGSKDPEHYDNSVGAGGDDEIAEARPVSHAADGTTN
ncbi:hypothetical protein B0H17DRAFT_1149948 [Mycena rosella]|uniref:Uncharacterized protein n=1 Tax=Mycena rosella TaxID=1033263 RepID=A0AAD7FN19_MYCRO|nr:hypothetical protein B0H17DRAFT_1149948 [Mycena rosella]